MIDQLHPAETAELLLELTPEKTLSVLRIMDKDSAAGLLSSALLKSFGGSFAHFMILVFYVPALACAGGNCRESWPRDVSARDLAACALLPA